MNKIKKQIIRIVLLVGTLVSLYFVPWVLVKAWMLPLPETVQGQLEEAVDQGFVGIIVYIDQAGYSPELYAAGLHNREKGIQAYPQAYFKIASISKLYIAVATTKLISRGILSLQASLTDYLPDLNGKIENANSITLKMLVEHRSGIPNYTDIPGYWEMNLKSRMEDLELVYNKAADFEPGSQYAYCNTNYLLLTLILDKVLEYPYFEFIQQNILDRLHLRHTYQSVNQVDIDSVMSGYHVGYEPDLKNQDRGMISTAEDVGVFLRALNSGSLFDPGEKEIYSSIYKFNHTGLVPGYQSIAEYHKDIDAVVIQFTNTTDSKQYNWNLSEIEYGRILKIIRNNRK
ncbi:MAG: serine hydrolase domain-containing protein [Bacteroidia bacterium]